MNADTRCRHHRLRLLEISQKVTALHLAGAFSCVDLVDSIYFETMSSNDVFLLSKGHAGIAQYVVLESIGILSKEELNNYANANSQLGVHPTRDIKGIYFGTGSLGHGLNIGIGTAIARKKIDSKVYVLISDGELQEGSTWEGIINAPNYNLDNLIVIVDFNNYQSLGRTSETHPNLLPLAEKFEAFGWETQEIDGHNLEQIELSLKKWKTLKPKILIANTVKGKGVSFMENAPIWHYRSPTIDEYLIAKSELQSK